MPTTTRTLLEPMDFGPYVLVELLGRGGMAEVLRARSFGVAGFQRDVAIKRILPDFALDEEFVTMFVDEARLMASLSHPNTVGVHDLGMIDDYYFMVMEYVAGKDFLAVLARTARARRRIPADIALHVVASILDGLAYVHGAHDAYGTPLHIVHRDVSPSNVFLSYPGVVKLGDFGIAKSSLQRHATAAGAHKGKLGYMSPEQAIGAAIDHRSDLFSTAVILFEALTMSRLFRGETAEVLQAIAEADIDASIERRRAYLDEEMEEILRRGLARDPADRYPDAASFRTALGEYARGRDFALDATRLRTFLADIFAEELGEDKLLRQREDERLRARASEAESMWYLRRGEGEVRGPLPFHQLRLVLEEAEHLGGCEVREGSGAWQPVDSVPRVADILRARRRDAAKASPAHAAMDEAQESSEDVDEATLRMRARKQEAETHPSFDRPTPSVGTRTSSAILRRASLPTQEALRLREDPSRRDPIAFARTLPEHPNDRRPHTPGGQTSVAHHPGGADPSPEEVWAKDPTPTSGGIRGVRFNTGSARPAATGEFGRSSYLRLLATLETEGRTGALRLDFGDVEREIFVVDGRVVQATTAAPEELIGAHAVAAGLLRPEDLVGAIERARATGQRLGDWLMQEGGVTPHAIYEVVRSQLVQKVLDAVDRSEGAWAWIPDRRTSERDIEIPLPIAPLLVRAVRERLPTHRLRAFFRPWRQRPLERSFRPLRLDRLPLDAQEMRIARSLRPGKTVEDTLRERLQERSDDDDGPMLRVLYLLVEADLLALPGRGPLRLERKADPSR